MSKLTRHKQPRPRILDLFCGAGGAAMGYYEAGFDVVGVDIVDQPRYPFKFIRHDAVELLDDIADYGASFVFDIDDQIDAIHASPPCQSESDLRHLQLKKHPDLLTPTIECLSEVSMPWVIENVESTSKLPDALILCGTEFGLQSRCRDGFPRHLARHRRFASNIPLHNYGKCTCKGRLIGGVYGTGGTGQQTRGYKFHFEEAQVAMDIDWMSKAEMSQAIPPAYTRHIGEQIMSVIKEAEVNA